MKKVYFFIILILFSSCTSLETLKLNRELKNSLSPLIVANRTTEKHIIDIFGKPYFIASRKESPYTYVYHKGTYYTKNSIQNKKILKSLLPVEIVYSQKVIKETFLEIYFDIDTKIVKGYKIEKYPEKKRNVVADKETLEKIEREKKMREKYRNADPTDILNNILFKEL
ncbi:hypothetical protein [uncultured Fusobacterium sp.]|uniref:hypothetical protein n=1 Tax=uncultured Fusobacterium sp. TaxID=159267 RepID=UPI0025EE9B9C|nr:hypothetical protein [uncultured Fusobacterium sp.]